MWKKPSPCLEWCNCVNSNANFNMQILAVLMNVNCFCCQWKRHWEGKQKKTNIANKTAFRYCRAVFYQGEKVWNFFFFFGSYFAGGICNMADFLKLMTSDHQQKFFFKVKWVNIWSLIFFQKCFREQLKGSISKLQVFVWSSVFSCVLQHCSYFQSGDLRNFLMNKTVLCAYWKNNS